MTDYFLGLDNGGSVTKAVVFDGAGAEIAAQDHQLRRLQ